MATNQNAIPYVGRTRAPLKTDTRIGIADTNYTATNDESIIGIKTLTTSRTITLPATARTGQQLIVKDESGACSSSLTLTISGAIDGATSIVLASAYAWTELYFNGNAWAKVV